METIIKESVEKKGKVGFDETYIKYDIQAAELFLSRLLAEHIIIENIIYGNRSMIGKIFDAPRNGLLPGWNKIKFIIEYFNGDTQHCEAKFDGESLTIDYGDFC